MVFLSVLLHGKYVKQFLRIVKTEFTRTLSNFDFQWTKFLYQNKAYCILHFSRAKDVINHL